MSAQTEVELVNSVRLVGRISAAPEEKILPSGSAIANFRVVIDRPPGHESEQRVDALDVHGVDVARAAIHQVLAQGRRGRGRRCDATALLRHGDRTRVQGGGRGQRGADDSSCTERMSTPRLGFGWNDVAFSGSKPPRFTRSRTAAKSGAGSSTATVRRFARLSASSAAWWNAIEVGASASEGMSAVCSHSTSSIPAPLGGVTTAHCSRIREDQGVGRERRPGPRPGRPGARDPPAAMAAAVTSATVTPGECPMDGAEEQGSVGLVHEHGQPAVPRRAGVCLLQLQVGGVPVMSVGDQRGAVAERGVDRGDLGRVRDGPDALLLLGPVEVLDVRCASRDGVEQRRARRQDPGGPAGWERGSSPSRTSARPVRRPARDGCPRGATRPGRRGRLRGGRWPVRRRGRGS